MTTKYMNDAFDLKAIADNKGSYILNQVRADRRNLVLKYQNKMIKIIDEALRRYFHLKEIFSPYVRCHPNE